MSKTFDLKQAADFLKMSPEGLRKKVVKGKIPGAKPGKCWCFQEEDLALHLRSLYAASAKASWGDTLRRQRWHSTKETIGGELLLVSTESKYKKLLGLPTKSLHNDIMTK